MHLKQLFAQLTVGKLSFADPSAVLNCLTNDKGNSIEIGDHKDIGEFNDHVLSRVIEALNANKIMQDYHDKKIEYSDSDLNSSFAMEDEVQVEDGFA